MTSRIIRRSTAAALVLAGLTFLLVPAAAQAPAPTGKGFIWRLERNGRTGWLVGSLHVLTPDFYPLPRSMSEAFRGSTTLVAEADLSTTAAPETAALVASRAMYANGETLKTQVSADTYRVTSERFAKIGVPMEAMDRMKPWMVAVVLLGAELQRAGFDPALGVDRHFFTEASRLGKKLRALETMAEQLELLAGLPAATQEALLRDTINSVDTEIGQVKTIAEAWRAGDAATIERILLTSMMNEPALYQSMIVERNRNWVPKIETCIAEDDCFVVVGAAHLVGPDGLLKALTSRGYTVQQQ